MAVSPLSPETVTGRVASVNPKGVRLEGQDGWLNFSRFAADIVPPMRGQTVTLTLDRQGFVRAVSVQDDSGVTPVNRGTPDASRDRTIARLAVLKAAAQFATARPQLKSGDVLTIAASWERWITRSESADDTVDAF